MSVSGYCRRSVEWAAWAVCILAMAGACEVCGLVEEQGSTKVLLRDWQSRREPVSAFDGLGPVFFQRSPEKCGHVALAFAFAFLGDVRSAGDVYAELPARPLSLAEIAEAAETKGFTAATLYADSLASLSLSHGRVAILHLSQTHFVAVWSLSSVEGAGTRVLMLDPRVGTVLNIDSDTVEV